MAAAALSTVRAAALNELLVALELLDMGARSSIWTFPIRLTDPRWPVGPLPLPFSLPSLGIYPVVQIAMTAFALTFVGLRVRRQAPTAISERVAG